MDHALKGSFNFEWITSATGFVVLWMSQTREHREKRQRDTEKRLLHWEHLVRGEHWLKSVQSDDFQACITTCVLLFVKTQLPIHSASL